jgi:hypothetical protein
MSIYPNESMLVFPYGCPFIIDLKKYYEEGSDEEEQALKHPRIIKKSIKWKAAEAICTQVGLHVIESAKQKIECVNSLSTDLMGDVWEMNSKIREKKFEETLRLHDKNEIKCAEGCEVCAMRISGFRIIKFKEDNVASKQWRDVFKAVREHPFLKPEGIEKPVSYVKISDSELSSEEAEVLNTENKLWAAIKALDITDIKRAYDFQVEHIGKFYAASEILDEALEAQISKKAKLAEEIDVEGFLDI